MSVTLRPHSKIVGIEYVTFGRNVMVDDFVLIMASKDHPVHIGNYCHIASHVTIAGGPVTLEDFTNIGAGSRLVAGSDDFHEALIGPTIPAKYRKVNRSGIVLKRHATLGANCVVLPGTVMGEGSAAGAGTVIKGTPIPWKIYVGAPMRVVGERNRDKIVDLELTLQLENALVDAF